MAQFRALNAQRLSESRGSNADERCTYSTHGSTAPGRKGCADVGADEDQGDPLFGGNRSQTEVRAENISE